MLAGKLFHIPVKGTHAHAYITSFNSINELQTVQLVPKFGGEPVDFVALSINWRTKLLELLQVVENEANDGELAALISFAIAFPDGFMALVDTYDVKRYPCPMPHTITLWPVTLPNTLLHNEYR